MIKAHSCSCHRKSQNLGTPAVVPRTCSRKPQALIMSCCGTVKAKRRATVAALGRTLGVCVWDMLLHFQERMMHLLQTGQCNRGNKCTQSSPELLKTVQNSHKKGGQCNSPCIQVITTPYLGLQHKIRVTKPS